MGDVIRQYDVDELKNLLHEGNVQIIDVRTPEEYQSGHIPNVPSKPMQDIGTWMDELNPQDSYVFVCRSGARSQRVAEFLSEKGFQHVANYDGGMLVWDGDVE